MRREESGFTLIELVVGMLLSVLLLWLLSSAFVVGGKAVDAAQSRYSAAHATFLLDAYLDADLQGAAPANVLIGTGGGSLAATWYAYDPATVSRVTYQAQYAEDASGHLLRQLTTAVNGVSQSTVTTLAWNVVPGGVQFAWGNAQHSLLNLSLTTQLGGVTTRQQLQIPLLAQQKGVPWP
ncbi:MAG: prepilin-type N-terminal cleavage/methylation domain-containing protein [Thermaerobacter sp.]|jgi:type II secretory pathway pseudopilin PulG|nr:prepilin-type N-terminal cleavage/methylation domain-containing protein [Thermaerobacter sp.]